MVLFDLFAVSTSFSPTRLAHVRLRALDDRGQLGAVVTLYFVTPIALNHGVDVVFLFRDYITSAHRHSAREVSTTFSVKKAKRQLWELRTYGLKPLLRWRPRGIKAVLQELRLINNQNRAIDLPLGSPMAKTPMIPPITWKLGLRYEGMEGQARRGTPNVLWRSGTDTKLEARYFFSGSSNT